MTSRVLIAGGGIGGLAAALAAVRAGAQAQVFERAEAFTEVGAGVQLGPNVMRRLQAWGIEDALAEAASYPSHIQARSAASGANLATLALGRDFVHRYGAAYACIHRGDLHTLLLRAARAHGVALHTSHAVQDFSDGEGGVIARVGAACFEGDALVCADGGRSRLRQQLLHEGDVQPTGHLAYRAIVPQASLPEHLRTRHVTAWLGRRLHVVQYPLRRGTLQNLVVIVQGRPGAATDAWDQQAHTAELEAALAHTCTALQDAVRAVAATHSVWRLWPLADRAPLRSAEQMAQGRVALLGDAAHPMRPYMAQGAGMAIEDAHELGQALAQHDLEMPLRLRRYALNRWQRNARVQARSERNGRIFHAVGPMRWGRDLALRVLGGRVMEVPWLYRG